MIKRWRGRKVPPVTLPKTPQAGAVKVKKFVPPRVATPKLNGRKLYITEDVIAAIGKWQFAVGDAEVNGMGLTARTEDGYVWHSAFLCADEIGIADVTASPESQAKVMMEILDSGYEPNELNLYWHTHGCRAFWSGTDLIAIEDLVRVSGGAPIVNVVFAGAPSVEARVDSEGQGEKQAEALEIIWGTNEEEFHRLRRLGSEANTRLWTTSPTVPGGAIAGSYSHRHRTSGVGHRTSTGAGRDRGKGEYEYYYGQWPDEEDDHRWADENEWIDDNTICPICGDRYTHIIAGSAGYARQCPSCSAEWTCTPPPIQPPLV